MEASIGPGGALARHFAREGVEVAMMARPDDCLRSPFIRKQIWIANQIAGSSGLIGNVVQSVQP